MKLKRLSDDSDVVRLQVVDRVIHGDPLPNLSEITGLLDERGHAAKVVLSLEDSEFIDSSGLSWLLECHQKFAAEGGTLVIHSVPPSVLDTFMMMRLDSVLQIAQDEAAALKVARGEQP